MINYSSLIRVLLFGVAVTSAQAAEIYRWVDAQGLPHFTHRPVEGAERISLDRIPVADLHTGSDLSGEDKSGPESRGGSGPAAPTDAFRIRLLYPSDQQMVWADDRTLQVAAAIEPPLASGSGLRIAVSIGGERRAVTNRSRLAIDDVDRGSHEIRVELIDPSGKVIARTDPVTVHVKQHHLGTPE